MTWLKAIIKGLKIILSSYCSKFHDNILYLRDFFSRTLRKYICMILLSCVIHTFARLLHTVMLLMFIFASYWELNSCQIKSSRVDLLNCDRRQFLFIYFKTPTIKSHPLSKFLSKMVNFYSMCSV